MESFSEWTELNLIYYYSKGTQNFFLHGWRILQHPPSRHNPDHAEQATFWGWIIFFPVWYILPQPSGASSIIASSPNFLWPQTEGAPWCLPAFPATMLVTLWSHLPCGALVIWILWVRASTWIWGWGVGVAGNKAAHNISLSGMCWIN